MLKEKLSPGLVIATVVVVLTAGTSLYLLVPGSFSFLHKTAKPAPPAAVTVAEPQKPEPPPPPPAPAAKARPKATKHSETSPPPPPVVVRDTVFVEKPSPKKIVEQIERKVRLAKPQSPDQQTQYVSIVYRACRDIGRIDKERALEWVDEGLHYTEDGSFTAFGALLNFRLGHRGAAQTMAEEALDATAHRLDPKSGDLAKAVIDLLKNPNDAGANRLVAPYEVAP